MIFFALLLSLVFGRERPVEDVLTNLTGIPQVVAFADANWNCATAACSSRVSAGTYQPNVTLFGTRSPS